MILDERSAAVFINGYQKLLLEICGPAGGNVQFLERLVEGRKKLMSDVSLLNDAVSRIHDRGQNVDETVIAAAASLQVKPWVYLRDTRRYSIFMEEAGMHAYGAVGITNSIKELLGGSGALVETGLLLYDGRIVCDGLISPLAWIGPSYKRSFNEALSDIRSAGNFYTDRLIKKRTGKRLRRLVTTPCGHSAFHLAWTGKARSGHSSMPASFAPSPRITGAKPSADRPSARGGHWPVRNRVHRRVASRAWSGVIAGMMWSFARVSALG